MNTLKTRLFEIFSKYKPINITAHKNVKMRGQAFITFEDAEHANEALNLNGLNLFNKKIEIKLANSSSNKSIINKISKEDYSKYEKLRNDKKDKNKNIVLLNTPPNKVLILQNLPENITKEEILPFFNKFEGFNNIKLVEALKIGLVEFDDEKYSIPVKKQELIIRDSKIIINYAKK